MVTDFPEFSAGFIRLGIESVATEVLTGLGVAPAEAAELTPWIGDAFLAHYAGDERFAGDDPLSLADRSLRARLIVGRRADLIRDLWQAPPPPDNDVIIDLRTGTWSEP